MIKFLAPHQLEDLIREFVGRKKYSLATIRGGLLGQNLKLSIAGSDHVVKVYRPAMNAEKVAQMHDVMKIASSHGIPTTSPQAMKVIEGFVCAIYPFVSGLHPRRYGGTHVQMKVMGDMLGRIHGKIGSFSFPVERPTAEKVWKPNRPRRFLEKIGDLRRDLRSRHATLRREIGTMLDAYERVVSEHDWPDLSAGLRVRLCHGDYTTANILLSGDKVAAVLDWEKTEWNFHCAELMRSVIFNCRQSTQEINWQRVKTYVEAYRGHVRISEREVRAAFECGFRNVVFSLWSVEQYLAGHRFFRINNHRRLGMVKYLFEHHDEFSEKVASLLSE